MDGDPTITLISARKDSDQEGEVTPKVVDLQTGVIEHNVNFEANLSDDEDASWDEEGGSQHSVQQTLPNQQEEYYDEELDTAKELKAA